MEAPKRIWALGASGGRRYWGKDSFQYGDRPYVRADLADALADALDVLLDHYTQLVNCGDCGNWDPEDEREVIDARAALTAYRETK